MMHMVRFAARLLVTLCSMAVLAGHELAHEARDARTFIHVPITSADRALCVATGGAVDAYEHPDLPGVVSVR